MALNEIDEKESEAGKKTYKKPQLRILCVSGGTNAKASINPSEASPSTGPGAS